MEKNYALLDLDEVNKDIKYASAVVEFPTFDTYLSQAKQIAEYINQVELTDSNVKEVKSTLAAARKVTDGLDRKRIDLKKQLLGNFSDFEEQIKELQTVISVAEMELRIKVKALEDQERETKKEAIADIWDKRFPSYRLSKYAGSYETFVKWLQPSFLNKTVSMRAVEQAMVDWLEERESDIKACEGMGDEYLTEYLLHYHLPTTITAVQYRQKKAQEIAEARSDANTEWVDDFDEDEPEVAIFYVTGTANIALTERLLNENKVTYQKK